jgi:hypothetical protein
MHRWGPSCIVGGLETGNMCACCDLPPLLLLLLLFFPSAWPSRLPHSCSWHVPPSPPPHLQLGELERMKQRAEETCGRLESDIGELQRQKVQLMRAAEKATKEFAGAWGTRRLFFSPL